MMTSDKGRGHPGHREKENRNHVCANLHCGDYPGRGRALSTITVIHGPNNHIPQIQKGPHNCPIIALWIVHTNPETQPGQNKKTGTPRRLTLWGFPG